jgi:hypothetical protein
MLSPFFVEQYAHEKHQAYLGEAAAPKLARQHSGWRTHMPVSTIRAALLGLVALSMALTQVMERSS